MNNERIIEKDIEHFQIENMNQYYQEILLRRAIPDIRDGLNNIQRRILYSMLESGYFKDYIKCANVIGQAVMYHPHSVDSIYSTLVTMAQWWCNNQTIIDPHGNI